MKGGDNIKPSEEKEPIELLEGLQNLGCLCLLAKKHWDGKNAKIHLCIEDRKLFDAVILMTDAKITDDDDEVTIGEAMVVFGFTHTKERC